MLAQGNRIQDTEIRFNEVLRFAGNPYSSYPGLLYCLAKKRLHANFPCLFGMSRSAPHREREERRVTSKNTAAKETTLFLTQDHTLPPLYSDFFFPNTENAWCRLHFPGNGEHPTLSLLINITDNGQRETPLQNAGACLLLPLIREIPRAAGHGGKVVLRSENYLSWCLNYSNSVERSQIDNQSVLYGLLRGKILKR